VKTVRPAPDIQAPAPSPTAPPVELPETLGYRLKNRLLGPPLRTDQLIHERLGKPTALAVFASDNLSSAAYATEEILHVLVPVVGVAAFSLVVPLTTALLIVLAFLILSYRETIKAYPTAGGAYMVTRDNFGLLPAQFAGVALLTDYVLTVAVSVAAGTDALTSAFSSLAPWHVWISIFFALVIGAGNLKGVRESGKLFAIPTYFFILNMAILLGVGVLRWMGGGLHAHSLQHPGVIPVGHAGDGLYYGATLFIVLHAFASGGAAVTGVEAISNGVTAFKRPEWKNARETLVIMGSTLGVMFFGLSLLSSKVHAVPYVSGTPTVISQVGKFVYGGGALGNLLYYGLQAGTMLILVLAANTSFADFPRLASFHAGDNFMPRQLTKRGHRLVFSNGIIALAAASIALLLLTQANVHRLIPLYAIGVFTSFTMSQAGMAKHHITHKEPNWRRGLFINAFGAFLSGVVDIVIAVTKFTHGAWFIVVLVPVMVMGLVRLNRQYESELDELTHDAPKAAEAPILRRHVVLVFVDALDVSAARAIQYARALMPDELRAIHFDLDPIRDDELSEAWTKLGFSRLTLERIECPDRRLDRAALEVVAEATADGETEVTVLLPRRAYTRAWHRLLHDRSADRIAEAVGQLPHANVTFVPYHLGTAARQQKRRAALAAVRGARLRLHRDGEAARARAKEAAAAAAGARASRWRVRRPSARCSGVSTPGWRDECARSASSPGRASPAWSAPWSTRRAAWCWSSWAAATLPASSPAPA
jgi:amino acid transporter